MSDLEYRRLERLAQQGDLSAGIRLHDLQYRLGMEFTPDREFIVDEPTLNSHIRPGQANCSIFVYKGTAFVVQNNYKYLKIKQWYFSNGYGLETIEFVSWDNTIFAPSLFVKGLQKTKNKNIGKNMEPGWRYSSHTNLKMFDAIGEAEKTPHTPIQEYLLRIYEITK